MFGAKKDAVRFMLVGICYKLLTRHRQGLVASLDNFSFIDKLNSV